MSNSKCTCSFLNKIMLTLVRWPVASVGVLRTPVEIASRGADGHARGIRKGVLGRYTTPPWSEHQLQADWQQGAWLALGSSRSMRGGAVTAIFATWVLRHAGFKKYKRDRAVGWAPIGNFGQKSTSTQQLQVLFLVRYSLATWVCAECSWSELSVR